MCNTTGLTFCLLNLKPEIVKGKNIIEIGSHNVNGSIRPILESYDPKAYVGIDIQPGPGVDIVCRAEDVIDHFGKESFDIVISTELIEHVEDWKKVITNIKTICRSGGIVLLTTRSYGFPYHGYPCDFWRYEEEDMKAIFSDFSILNVTKDTLCPGVFISARKPQHFRERDLKRQTLFSIVSNRRIEMLDEDDVLKFTNKQRKLIAIKDCYLRMSKVAKDIGIRILQMGYA